MRDPVRILVKRDELTLEGIKQVRGKTMRNMRNMLESERNTERKILALTWTSWVFFCFFPSVLHRCRA